MRLDIPQNATQEEFELILKNNPDVTKLYCSNTNITSIPQLKNLTELDCLYCPELKIENIEYLPKLIYIRSHIRNFKEQNEHIYKLKLIRHNIEKVFKKK